MVEFPHSLLLGELLQPLLIADLHLVHLPHLQRLLSFHDAFRRGLLVPLALHLNLFRRLEHPHSLGLVGRCAPPPLGLELLRLPLRHKRLNLKVDGALLCGQLRVGAAAPGGGVMVVVAVVHRGIIERGARGVGVGCRRGGPAHWRAAGGGCAEAGGAARVDVVVHAAE